MESLCELNIHPPAAEIAGNIGACIQYWRLVTEMCKLNLSSAGATRYFIVLINLLRWAHINARYIAAETAANTANMKTYRKTYLKLRLRSIL